MHTQQADLNTAAVALPPTVLAVAATGRIGRLAVVEALRQGYKVRALIRDLTKLGACCRHG